MTYPVFDTSGLTDARPGHGGPVMCAACGCRLQRTGDSASVWFHFAPIAGRDARGCRVDCADAAHDARGHTLNAAG